MKISVVVPVRDEQDSIRELLESLLSQTLRPEEIVITDGGSQDATPQIVEELIGSGAPIKLIREKAALPGRGRNVAARQASCEWIAFTDAGIRPAKDWLEKLARRAMNEPSVDVVYGSYEPITGSLFEESAAIAYVPPRVEMNGVCLRPRWIASSLMRRKVWESVGGFPEDLRSAEDLLFMEKVEKAGFQTTREPGALVFWNIQPTLWRTFKRFVTYSRNNIRAGLWHDWQAAIFRQYVLFLLLGLLAIIIGRWWVVATAGFWLGLLAARAFMALRRNRRCFPASPARNSLRLLLLMPIIATLDAAAFLGFINWLLLDKLHLRIAMGNNGADG